MYVFSYFTSYEQGFIFRKMWLILQMYTQSEIDFISSPCMVMHDSSQVFIFCNTAFLILV